jgi:hypothetical protein
MSQERHHPVYVVRLPNNEGCGHQHSSRKKAWNCAEIIAGRRRNLSYIEVVKIQSIGHGTRELVVGRVRQYSTCEECKGLVFLMDDNSERGHYEDCSRAKDD